MMSLTEAYLRPCKTSVVSQFACNFIKERLQHKCFPVTIVKMLRTPILKNNYKWLLLYIWDKVFKNGLGKICGRQPLKNLKEYDLLKQTIQPFKFFKGCLPQTLLDPFLNTLSHILLQKMDPLQMSGRVLSAPLNCGVFLTSFLFSLLTKIYSAR